MGTLKVLQLRSWMNESRGGFDECISRYKEIPVVFGRNGIYRRGKECWFELNGKAYEYELDTFVFEFKLLDIPDKIGPKEIEAYRVLNRANLLNKVQQEQLYFYDHRVYSRTIKLDTWRWRNKMMRIP